MSGKITDSKAVQEYLSQMTPSTPEDIICECSKCGKDMTDKEVNEIPEEVFDPDAPVCETCRTPSQQVPAWFRVSWFRVKVEWDTDGEEVENLPEFVVFEEDVCRSIREDVEDEEDFENEIVRHLEGLTDWLVKDWEIVEQKETSCPECVKCGDGEEAIGTYGPNHLPLCEFHRDFAGYCSCGKKVYACPCGESEEEEFLYECKDCGRRWVEDEDGEVVKGKECKCAMKMEIS